MSKKTIIHKILKTIVALVLLATMFVVYLQIRNIRPSPTQEIVETCEIDEKEYQGNKVYTISPKENKDTTGKTIIYFHGGAYMAEMTEQHWDFIKKLVLDTRITVVLPAYPIAPKYCYTDTLEFCEAVYKDVIKEKGSKNVIVMGDSAGGGLALALEEKMSIEQKNSNENTNLPQSTILISPWLDVSMSNDEIDKVQKYDNDLNKEKLLAAGVMYARGTDTKNYFVSPLYGDLSNLKNVTIFTGTYDILNPDVHLLVEKAKNVNITINVKEYEKASHIWIINKNCEQQLIDDGYSDLKKFLLN